jgi:hypothetical protein
LTFPVTKGVSLLFLTTLTFFHFSGELPYLETTLPQERPGTVTITPSNRRISGANFQTLALSNISDAKLFYSSLTLDTKRTSEK